MQNRRIITSVLAFWIQCTGTVYHYEYVLLLHVVEDLFSKVCESFQNLTVIFGRTFDLLSSFFSVALLGFSFSSAPLRSYKSLLNVFNLELSR